MELVRVSDGPSAWADVATFPRFLSYGAAVERWWPRLEERFPDFQLALVDDGLPVAELRSAPLGWDGSESDLPGGWDEAVERAFGGRPPDVLCALAAAVRPERRGAGLAERLIAAMRELARTAGLRELIAPVRPTLKARYPLIPIERYLEWRRPDRSHFDPWIRLHERVGGQILAPAPESTRIEARVADWEEWTGMAFPGDGDHVVPEMLAPLRVANGVGTHVEPNVWIRHRV